MATINKTLMNLYENKNGNADVTFLVNGQEVKAHKCIITDRSETLKAMIKSDLAPPNGRHRIEDEKINIEDFKQFLKFLYLDECDIDPSNIGALLHMSQVYFVPLLKERCMKFVERKSTTTEDIIQCYENGILCECPEFFNLCIKELARRECFGKHPIPAELIERIAKDCPRYNFSDEDKLMVEIYEWGKAECARRNIPADKEGIKKVLSPIIKYMNLKDVSYHTWAHIIYPNELAPLEECLKHLADFAIYIINDVPSQKLTPQMLEIVSTPNGCKKIIYRHYTFRKRERKIPDDIFIHRDPTL